MWQRQYASLQLSQRRAYEQPSLNLFNILFGGENGGEEGMLAVNGYALLL